MLATVAGLALAVVIAVVGINVVVCLVGAGALGSADKARELDADCILVLGASVLPDGSPSDILRDRLDAGAELYFDGVAPKLLVSGDNGDDSYNEVAAMKAYLVSLGVPSEDVFCDHCGFNTYDSMWRARNVFGVNRIIVVTQTYHEYRALFNAEGVGMQAKGVSSDLRTYANQDYYDFREVLARVKDVGQVLTHQPATVQGEHISLYQSGDVTD
jgi:vancomycin permeability regulator SanA